MGVGFGSGGGAGDVTGRERKSGEKERGDSRVPRDWRGRKNRSGIKPLLHEKEEPAIGAIAADFRSNQFGFQFGPAGVEGVHAFLRLFEFDAGSVEFAGVAGNFGVAQGC